MPTTRDRLVPVEGARICVLVVLRHRERFGMEHTSYDFAGVVYLVTLWDRTYQ